MSIDEFLKNAEKTAINSENVKKVEEIYSTSLDDFLSKVVSMNSESIFIENAGRRLSFYEILNSDDEYGTEFVSEHIIPIFDLGDNDFLGFNYKENKWEIYNIVDKCVFDTKDNLLEFFSK